MNKLRSLLPYIFLIFVSLLLSWVYFRGLKSGEFIFSGDQLLRFSYSEAFINSFFLRKVDYFGVFNSWQQIVQFWDTIFYLVFYKLGFSLIEVEKISFFITLVISFLVSFIGFKKLNKLFNLNASAAKIVIVTLWYCINPYAMVLWHGGIYNIGLSITYSLTPLVLYYFELAVFQNKNIRNKLICVILMFVSSFTFWLFAVDIFFLTLYWLLSIIIRKKNFIKSIKNLISLVILFMPLASIIIFTILHEFLNNAGDVNSQFYASFQSQQGGMWYQFLMLFSWGIYNVWTPRSLYPFGQYFLSTPYKTVTLLIYLIIVIGVILRYKGKVSSLKMLKAGVKNFSADIKNKYLFIFLSIFIISVFFAKAAQPPFGNIFLFFYNYVPFFSVFRSADHRFGFAIVFSVSILLLYASKKYKSYLFFSVLLLLSIAQTYPMYFGNAVRGENIDIKYYDRIASVTPDYKDLANYINTKDNSLSYILTIPSVDYGVYSLDIKGSDHLVGQDLLPKIINKPFVYLSNSSGMSKVASDKLTSLLQDRQFKDFAEFPIKYIIFRKDVTCEDCLLIKEKELLDIAEKVYKNDSFSLFKLKKFSPIINGMEINYKTINPVKFKVELLNIKDKENLNLMFSFNKNWKIYLDKYSSMDGCEVNTGLVSVSVTQCIGEKHFFNGDEAKYLFNKGGFNSTHELSNGYGNKWIIDPDFVIENFDSSFYKKNQDGSINLSLTIYYQPQSWYYVFAVITLVVFVLYLTFIKVLFKKK